MFSQSCKQVAQFTGPIVLCRKTVAGVCSGSLGAFVVVNEDGWIATAGHILEQLGKLQSEVTAFTKLQTDISAIKKDASIEEKERKKRINKLPKPSNQDTEAFGQIWGVPGVVAKVAHIFQPVDLGLAKLEPFDPSAIAAYPVFKDPAKNFDPGKMLCRTGFPFHKVNPLWDSTNKRFDLPLGTFPVPRFPIEGIFTRQVELIGTGPSPVPFKWIETSSPGLRGQSGGPIFDEKGTIWGIQCQTMSYDLGFETKTKTPQYLNVGVGVHPETLFAAFQKFGIRFRVSSD